MTLQSDIAEKLENVTWHGDYFSALCPFHTDNRPSLLVYPDGFHCKACGARGSLRKLERQTSSLPTKITVPHLRGLPIWSRWYCQYGGWDAFVDAAHHILLDYPDTQNYLKARGVSEHIKEGHFGYMDGWYTFPVYDQSKHLVDLVIRGGPLKHGMKYVIRPREPNEHLHLYVPDWKKVQQEESLYVPFGILDVWALHAVGLASATEISGKSVSPDLLEPFRKPIFIIPDKDVAENMESTSAYGLARELGWRGRVLMLDYPEDAKDPNEIKTKHGKDVLLALIRKAEEMFSWQESTGKVQVR